MWSHPPSLVYGRIYGTVQWPLVLHLRTLSLNTLLSKLNAFALFFVKWISYKALYSSCLHSPFPYILARPAKIVSNDIFPLCCTLTGLATLCMIMTHQSSISLHVWKLDSNLGTCSLYFHFSVNDGAPSFKELSSCLL